MNTRSVTILGLIQVSVVIFGTLFVSGMLKVYGYTENPHLSWSPIAVFIRHYGLVLLIIPLIWIAAAIPAQAPERHPALPYASTLFGIVLLIFGTFFYIVVAIGSGPRLGPLQ